MLKIISTIVAILVIAFFPPAALAFISQNAVPGERTYPVKRKLEDGILLVAGLRPEWKAAFSVTQSDRRLEETKTLITTGKSAYETLKELVNSTSVAESEINDVSDTYQRTQLQNNLNQSINKYESTLT